MGNVRNIAFWVVLLVLVLALFNLFNSTNNFSSQTVSYSDFMAQVDAGEYEVDAHQVAEVRDAITAKLEASTPWLMFFPALRRPMFGVGPWDHFLKADKNARRLP